MRLLNYFDAYVRAGLKVIPLYARTKIPVGQAWNTDWNHDWCRWSFGKYPESNIGILLGEIVDVEGDDEEANHLLWELVGDTPHPMYRSSKSVHHLFQNPDPTLTALRRNNIEFRANKHQSVLPPSRHDDGSEYQWLRGTKFPAPPMPEPLLDFYNLIKVKKPLLKPGHIRPWCTVCGRRKFINRKRYELEKEALDGLGYLWQCHNCREFDLRDMCRKLRKAHAKSQAAKEIRQT
jgi:hypothetical protein